MVQPVTGVLETPWLCHAWTRGTHTCSSSSIQDCTCGSVRSSHLILTGRSVGYSSVEKGNIKSVFFYSWLSSFLLRANVLFTSLLHVTAEQLRGRRGAHTSASSYAASWQQLGVRLRSWQRLYRPSDIRRPPSVCVNSYVFALCAFIFKYCMLWRIMKRKTDEYLFKKRMFKNTSTAALPIAVNIFFSNLNYCGPLVIDMLKQR